MLITESFPSTILQKRRQNLARLVNFPVILWSGEAPKRNFPGNTYPFRASSHFLYLAGLSLEKAAIRLEGGRLELYWDEPEAEDRLWHGESLSLADVGAKIGADEAYPFAELKNRSAEAGTIALPQWEILQQQREFCKRDVQPAPVSEGVDRQLAEAIVQLRLIHDESSLEELRQAAAVTVEAHKAGMQALKKAKTEAVIRGAMEGAIIARNLTCAYRSIVTTRGEILHNSDYHNTLQSGDLVLADVGAESPGGWATDVTRTFPVMGQFSPTQWDIYQVVLAAHDACIKKIQAGVEFRDLHLLAATVLVEGLLNLGILQGEVSSLVERDVHSLFFPHGLGHLLGLDVHDLEDLGDLAGYAPGRTRSDRFGLCYLRLDRPLQAGMVVTIEPGFYQIPHLLKDLERRQKYQDAIDWERLARFSDVRGIRIEDDVLVTETGCEVLTANLPTSPRAIEQLVSQQIDFVDIAFP